MTKKSLQIFKTGTHTSSAGDTLTFGEDKVSQTADVYNPELHEAPIVVGHPKSNGPAYGWIKSLSFDDGSLEAEPDQVDPDFQELVNAGRFKKISASFYSPDSPQNPVPGSYYLRHVGFLGAQAPALKGMRDAEFNEDEEGIIEFSTPWQTRWGFHAVANIFKRMRDYMIEKEGVEAADKHFPAWELEDIQEAAKEPPPEPIEVPAPDFSEDNPTEDPDMTVEELQAALDAEKQKNEALEGQVSDFQEREQALAAKEKATADQAATAAIDALVTSGQVLPAMRDSVVEYAMQLDDTVSFDFAEGEETKQSGQRERFIALLGQLPKAVNFGEELEDDEAPVEFGSAEELSQAALEYQAQQAEKGIEIDIVAAINAVQNQDK